MTFRREKWAIAVSALALTAAIAVAIWAYWDRQQTLPESLNQQGVPAIPTVLTSDSSSPLFDGLAVVDSVPGVEVIQFLDGEKFTIAFKDPFPYPPDDYRPDNLAHGYHDLAVMAEKGDAAAATVLYEMLWSCKGAYYQTDDQYEEGRRDIIERGIYKRVFQKSGELMVLEAGPTDIALNIFEKSFEICRSLTDDMKNEAMDWQRRAAELGDPRQMVSSSMYEGNTDLGRQMLKDAFLSGHYSAGTILGDFLIGQRVPYVVEEESTPYDEGQFRIDGFAYYYLAVTLAHADRTIEAQSSEMMHQGFNLAVAHLSPFEHEAGIARAKKILRSHPNCCQSSTPYNRRRQ